MSQPHMHNVLKGVRTLSPEFADQLLQHLGLTLTDLCITPESPVPAKPEEFHSFQAIPVLRGSTGPGIFPFAPERVESTYPFLRSQVSKLTNAAALSLHNDRMMTPRFQAEDLVLLDRSEEDRMHPNTRSAYIVSTPEGAFVRYIRHGGRSLYFVTEESMADPRRWDYFSLAGKNILEVIRGRIVWIGRKMDTVPADPPRTTG